MKKLLKIFCITIVTLVLLSSTAKTAGISVDAGLTPPEDRWILRTQLRYMAKKNDVRKMSNTIISSVFAYGIRRNLTFMIKQMVLNQKMSMGESDDKKSGLSDLSLLCKYGLYRHNTREYIFGIASTLALELPTGNDTFTSETWDIRPGLYLSLRKGYWATDLNISYSWNGFTGQNSMDINPGDELSLDWALAHQFSLGNKSQVSLAPVLELSFKKILPDYFNNQNVSNTGESIFFVSPGIKYTKSSFILETLIQLPAWQSQKGVQLKHSTRGLVGLRFMF